MLRRSYWLDKVSSFPKMEKYCTLNSFISNVEEIFNIPEFKDMDVLAERIFKPDLRGIAKI